LPYKTHLTSLKVLLLYSMNLILLHARNVHHLSTFIQLIKGNLTVLSVTLSRTKSFYGPVVCLSVDKITEKVVDEC